ncbi:MAG: bifunctional adenosylcobinamide kinase/adenosylcobinamide-phosphate guanylyltransferase [Spirochaetaceae bacterium]|jgi:adenosylcobinamide kinase/adenosylcobinamide-phosphate guanylyltransferase|nr:bifunctional adenosylcobinamide kinase/adenosylcobinamide-phosphate guanylyltransferase [Spirochaetaceae bacterium]
MITLITGGIKSGKSSRAISLAKEQFYFPASFIATAEALDNEMKARIIRHKEERQGLGFKTIEETLNIDSALASCENCVLLDCIPMWVNNIIYYKKENNFDSILDNFIHTAKNKNCIVVTNETGMGNIPFDEEIRRYNIMLSDANKKIAAAANTVELLVSGIPLRVK